MTPLIWDGSKAIPWEACDTLPLATMKICGILYLKERPPVSQSRGDGEGGGEGEYLRPADRVKGGTPALSTPFRDRKQTPSGLGKSF